MQQKRLRVDMQKNFLDAKSRRCWSERHSFVECVCVKVKCPAWK